MKDSEERTPRQPKDWKSLTRGEEVMIRGRVGAVRRMKISTFADIISAGNRIQIRILNVPDHYQLALGDLVEASGTVFETDSGELTVDSDTLAILSKWNASVAYTDSKRKRRGPLAAFRPETFERTYLPNLLRLHVREFLVNHDFLEVQTPILSRSYNGGRSFPVTSSYLGRRIGFNRTTMEERMQALLGAGHERIFEIGSIFRSGYERTFLEFYAAYLPVASGRQLAMELLAHVVTKLLQSGIGAPSPLIDSICACEWEEADFLAAAKSNLGLAYSEVASKPERVRDELLTQGLIEAGSGAPERLADTLAEKIATKSNKPVIVLGFPVWSSPLYAVTMGTGGEFVLDRGRMYLPDGRWGFEFGRQERDYNELVKRIRLQRMAWNLPADDDRLQASALELVVAGGVPPTFGFAASIDRILHLWRTDCNIDPFGQR